MFEESIDIKQKYLRDNIIDKGYDAEAFMAYCEQNYGTIDLQGWQLNKLKSIVGGFLGNQAEVTFTQQQLDNDDNFDEYVEPVQIVQLNDPSFDFGSYIQVTPPNPVLQTKNQIVFSDSDWMIFGFSPVKKPQNTPPVLIVTPSMTNIPPYKTLAQSITINQYQTPQPKLQIKKKQLQYTKSQKLTTSVLKPTQISELGLLQMKVVRAKPMAPMPNITDIKILKAQQKTKNFLQADYTLYTIELYPIKVQLQKKFNDFRKLRTILQKIYPHIRLPYLEPQGWLMHSQGKDPETLTKYKYQIVEFLKFITIRNELLKKSKITHIFCNLLQEAHTDFKKYQNIVRPKTFSQLCLPDGKLSFSKYQYFQNVDKIVSSTQGLILNIDSQYQKMKRAFETLFYNYQLVDKSLGDIHGIFQSLENLMIKFNVQNDVKRDLRVFEGIKEICNKMKENINNQYSVFRSRLQPLFKYERQNISTMKQTGNETRPRMYAQLSRQGLHQKNMSEFLKDDMSQLDPNILIDQPAKSNKNQLIIQNSFWSSACLKNIDEYWRELRFKICETLTLIAYDALDSENSQLNFWNSVIKKCVI